MRQSIWLEVVRPKKERKKVTFRTTISHWSMQTFQISCSKHKAHGTR